MAAKTAAIFRLTVWERCSLGDWERVEQIFSAAVELPETERAAFLDRVCGGDARLLTEVRELLEADRQHGSLLTAVRRETQALLKIIAGPAEGSEREPT